MSGRQGPTPPAGTDFPATYYIKALGKDQDELLGRMTAIVRTHAPQVGPDAFQCRLSREGRYAAVTCTLEAESREQLDAIYRELSADQAVILVL